MELSDICVQSTTDYNKIKHIAGNRMVNPQNVRLIASSMKNRQLCVPAILNEKMEVIDGQHRLEACRESGLPFYYIVVPGYGLADVQRINSNMKNWRLEDFLSTYITLYNNGNREYQEYAKFQIFMDDYGLGLIQTLTVATRAVAPKAQKDAFIHGSFHFPSENKSRIFIDQTRELFSALDKDRWKETAFIKAFLALYHLDGYDESIMAKNAYRLIAGNTPFHSLQGIAAFRVALVEAYNYHQPRKDKITTQDLENSMRDMEEGMK